MNIAHDLLAAGLDVVLADRKPKPNGTDGESGSTCFLQGDLSDKKFVIELVETVRHRFGRLDYLVNTTGVLWFDQMPHLQPSISTSGIEYSKLILNLSY